MNKKVVSVSRIIKSDPTVTSKLEQLSSETYKYNATSIRLKHAHGLVEEAYSRLKKEDILGYKNSAHLAIITYCACFNKSKLLAKIDIHDIVGSNLTLNKTHQKVLYLRDKLIAHLDKIEEIEYEVDLVFSEDGKEIATYETPFFEEAGINIDFLDNLKKLIQMSIDYIDPLFKQSIQRLLSKMRNIHDDKEWFDLCSENGLLNES